MRSWCLETILPLPCFGHRVSANLLQHYLDSMLGRTCSSFESRLKPKSKTTPSHEPFEFGHGPPQYSKLHAYLPCCFDGSPSTCCLLGASVLDTTNDIPLLGSNVLLKEKLKATLDLSNQRAHLDGLKCSAPIVLLNGHLAWDIMASFPLHVLILMTFGRASHRWLSERVMQKHRLESSHRPPHAADIPPARALAAPGTPDSAVRSKSASKPMKRRSKPEPESYTKWTRTTASTGKRFRKPLHELYGNCSPTGSSMNASGPTTSFGTTSTMKKAHICMADRPPATSDRELQVYASMRDLLEVFAGTAK